MISHGNAGATDAKDTANRFEYAGMTQHGNLGLGQHRLEILQVVVGFKAYHNLRTKAPHTVAGA